MLYHFIWVAARVAVNEAWGLANNCNERQLLFFPAAYSQEARGHFGGQVRKHILIFFSAV